MNIYMKRVLSEVVVDEALGMRGVPIGFLLTAVQQLVAFTAFGAFLLIGEAIGGGYKVRRLASRREVAVVFLFSATFAANVGLNNFSLSMVAISINMIIRSCLPLATAVSELAMGRMLSADRKARPAPEWALMLMGVTCAALATWSKGTAAAAQESSCLGLGVACGVASICSGALNMVLAEVLGGEMRLSPLDTTCYMALPAALMLLLPAAVVSHPVSGWPGREPMTDWQVLTEALARRPSVMVSLVFSGVLALAYNVLQYTMVHRLSASYAAFSGNFNKAATIALSLLLGLEGLPDGAHGVIFLCAVAGNVAAFTAYSVWRSSAGPSSNGSGSGAGNAQKA